MESKDQLIEKHRKNQRELAALAEAAKLWFQTRPNPEKKKRIEALEIDLKTAILQSEIAIQEKKIENLTKVLEIFREPNNA